MLVTVVKELSEYNNIVVTLFPQNHFGDELKADKYYCLDLRSVLLLPFSKSKLQKIIIDEKVDIVHSHLYWPTVLARIATPKNIPLITTIHAFIASSVEYKKWYIKLLDSISYKFHRNIIVTVAEGALKEYFSFLKVKPYKAYALHTFVDVKIFNNKKAISEREDNDVFRLITVGALRQQKNHRFLIKAFEQLDNKKFKLDIFGEGPLRQELQDQIDKHKINVNLKGEVKNIENIINQYDLYVMSSTFEGFSLSVLEAMAMKMPLLLSDIESFREQCQHTAVYFKLDNVNDFTDKLNMLSQNKNLLISLSEKSHERAINNFTLEQHMQGLRKIYVEALGAS